MASTGSLSAVTRRASGWPATVALLVLTALLALVPGVGVAAAAGSDPGGQATTTGNGGSLGAGQGGSTAPGTGGGLGSGAAYNPNAPVCVITSAFNIVPYNIAFPPPGQTAADGASMGRVCGPAALVAAAIASPRNWTCGACTLSFVWVKNATPSPAQIAKAVWNSLPLQKPDIHTNPDTTTKHLVVGLPTWLWVDGRKDGLTKTSEGVTITAHQKVVWYADGVQVSGSECSVEAGAAYTPGTDPRAKPPCGHTFASAGDHALRADVTWTGTFHIGGGPELPIDGNVAWTVTKAVGVDEIQTVNH